jgi:hypothetical protein
MRPVVVLSPVCSSLSDALRRRRSAFLTSCFALVCSARSRTRFPPFPLFPSQLVFRTLNRDLGLPNHNDDYLAERLRDELMPVRSWMLKHLPGSKSQLRVSAWLCVYGSVNRLYDACMRVCDAAFCCRPCPHADPRRSCTLKSSLLPRLRLRPAFAASPRPFPSLAMPRHQPPPSFQTPPEVGAAMPPSKTAPVTSAALWAPPPAAHAGQPAVGSAGRGQLHRRAHQVVRRRRAGRPGRGHQAGAVSVCGRWPHGRPGARGHPRANREHCGEKRGLASFASPVWAVLS